jgi:hypothetical protein
MNRHSPLAANLGNPGHWNPGQRLIYISPGVANRIKSEELADVTLDEAFVLQLPLDPSPSDLVQIARSAHEIWILQGEACGKPPFELLLKFRSQSIPVSAGERRSVLHAPELGIVRLFDVASAGDLVCQKVLLPLGEAERTLDAAWADMRTFAKRIASIEGNSVACTPADAQPSRSLPTSTLEQLRIASLQSAWQDDRSVRWVLASLFAVTVVGVVLLQAMATAGRSIRKLNGSASVLCPL